MNVKVTIVQVNDCPKCGGKPRIAELPGAGSVGYVCVVCKQCEFAGPSFKFTDYSAKCKAVDEWNVLA